MLMRTCYGRMFRFLIHLQSKRYLLHIRSFFITLIFESVRTIYIYQATFFSFSALQTEANKKIWLKWRGNSIQRQSQWIRIIYWCDVRDRTVYRTEHTENTQTDILRINLFHNRHNFGWTYFSDRQLICHKKHTVKWLFQNCRVKELWIIKSLIDEQRDRQRERDWVEKSDRENG